MFPQMKKMILKMMKIVMVLKMRKKRGRKRKSREKMKMKILKAVRKKILADHQECGTSLLQTTRDRKGESDSQFHRQGNFVKLLGTGKRPMSLRKEKKSLLRDHQNWEIARRNVQAKYPVKCSLFCAAVCGKDFQIMTKGLPLLRA